MSAAAEEPKEEGHAEGEAKPKSGGSKLPLIVAVVNTVGLLGLAGFVVLSKGKTAEDPKHPGAKDPAAVASAAGSDEGGEGAAAAEGEAKEGEAAAEGKGGEKATLIVSLGTFIINLKEPGGERYLKCKI